MDPGPGAAADGKIHPKMQAVTARNMHLRLESSLWVPRNPAPLVHA
jgi:hypothetical protein